MQYKEQSYDFYVEVDGKPFNGNAAITQKDTEKSDDADTQDKTKEDKSENTAGKLFRLLTASSACIWSDRNDLQTSQLAYPTALKKQPVTVM